MPRLTTLIIADDLTGALDSVAPFAAVGMDCLVATSPDSLPRAIAHAPEVLSINLGTRELDPEKARAVARMAASAARRHVDPRTIWVKKIDSRMKGHVAAEVAGVNEVVGAVRILMCPAIPDLGRVVRGGHVEGEGVMTPIPLLLPLSPDIDVSKPDARTEADLDRLVRASPPGTLFVGARGLAAALARCQRPGQLAARVPMPEGPVGFCIGSRDPITLAQVDRLRTAAGLTCLAAPDGVVPHRPGPGEMIVQATQGTGTSPEQVAARLADGFLGCMEGLKVILATGGETSAALLRAAGIGVLRVVGEVLPGLPLCHAVEIPGFPELVTKSGGFGQPDTLLQVWLAARSKEEQPCP